MENEGQEKVVKDREDAEAGLNHSGKIPEQFVPVGSNETSGDTRGTPHYLHPKSRSARCCLPCRTEHASSFGQR